MTDNPQDPQERRRSGRTGPLGDDEGEATRQSSTGGSAWGAGTFAGADGSRQPSAKELEVAEIQGGYFYSVVAAAKSG